ncbi:ABC transporter permease, partial [Myxococcus sp. 1LA]
LGASRGRLVAQFLTESLVLSLAGGVLGLLLAQWGTDALVALVGDALPRASEVRLDARPLAFTMGVSLLTGVLFGLGPALHGSRGDLSTAMREGSRSTEGRGSGRMRAGLVVGQVAVALVLLVGAGLFTKSFLALRAVDAGFTPEGVLTGKLALPPARYPDAERRVAFQRELLGRLQSLPGVEAVGVTNLLPLGGRSDTSFDIEGRPRAPDEVWPAVEFRSVSPGYLRALRVTPRQGHLLEGDGTEGPDAPWQVVINKTFADLYWPQGDALGQRLKPHAGAAEWTTVVGIVDDVREWGLDTPARPAAYYLSAKLPQPFLGLAVRAKSGNPEALRTAIEAELRAVDGNLALYGVAPLSSLVDESISSRQVSALLMGLFAGTALLLAAL